MTEELIARALEASANGDADARWEQVSALHRDGSESTLLAAVALCVDDDASKRALGADILGQLGGSGTSAPHRDEAAPVLVALLHDDAADVVEAAVCAHGHLELPVDSGLLAALAAHPSADVRFALACMLPQIAGPHAAPMLMQLMGDPDDDVRDWATFGVGSQLDLDSTEIREALVERLQIRTTTPVERHWSDFRGGKTSGSCRHCARNSSPHRSVALRSKRRGTWLHRSCCQPCARSQSGGTSIRSSSMTQSGRAVGGSP